MDMCRKVDFNGFEWISSSERISPYRMNLKIASECLCHICTGNANSLEKCKVHKLICNCRIGSPSIDGEVFKVVYNDEIPMALKIMPIMNDKHVARNMNEIDIAVKASNLVKTGCTTHFPMVFGHGQCEVIMDVESPFKGPGVRYHMLEKFANAIPSRICAKRFRISRRRSSSREIIETASEIFPFQVVEEIAKDDHQFVDLMASELAWGDLLRFYEENKDVDLWKNIITEALHAIRDMQQLLGVFHGDLHWGNLLIMIFEDNSLEVLIHDFGRSVILDKWTSNEYKDDILKFLEGFENVEMPKLLLENILKLADFVEQHPGNEFTVDDAIQFWLKS